MTQNNKTLNDLKGIVCIDCWELDDLTDYYKRLEEKLDFDQFDSIAVANYELRLDSSDLCQYNILEVYSWETYTPNMLLPVMKESRNKTTSNWLKTKFSTNSFLILDPESMQHHVATSVPHVTDWLVIGGSWGACTHFRPLSFKSMLKLPYNFYITDWSLYDSSKPDYRMTKEQIDKDTFNWVDQGNSLYRLQP